MENYALVKAELKVEEPVQYSAENNSVSTNIIFIINNSRY